MKRRAAEMLRLCTAILLFSLFSTAAVCAKSVTCPQLQVTISLLSDGAVEVKEDWTFDFEGSFSLFSRPVPQRSGYRITDVCVGEKGRNYRKLMQPDRGDRPEGCYAVITGTDRVDIDIYHRTENKKKTLTCRYRIQDIFFQSRQQVHFYWTVPVGIDVEQVSVRLFLPRGADESQCRVAMLREEGFWDSFRAPDKKAELPLRTFITPSGDGGEAVSFVLAGASLQSSDFLNIYTKMPLSLFSKPDGIKKRDGKYVRSASFWGKNPPVTRTVAAKTADASAGENRPAAPVSEKPSGAGAQAETRVDPQRLAVRWSDVDSLWKRNPLVLLAAAVGGLALIGAITGAVVYIAGRQMENR